VQEIAIIGAGEIGGATAHALARCDLARTITLVDERGRVAAGKALDIAQAAPIEGFATQLAGATDIAAAAGAEVVVVADRFGAGEWTGDDAFALLRRLSQMVRHAIVVCAGAKSRELVDRAVRDLKWPRARLLGSAPEALVGGAKAMVALALNGSARDIALTVLGIPPAQLVIPWNDATAGGLALTRQLDEPTRRRLDAKIAALWPPGPYALAAAATKAIAAIDGRSRQLSSCFVGPGIDQAATTRTAAMPVRLGPGGIADVVVPSLSVVEQVALDNAVLL
jgi:malate dehydrogenase